MHIVPSLVKIYAEMLIPLTIQKIERIYAQSKKRPTVEEISNALRLPTLDQLHRVFLQISLITVVRREESNKY